MTRLHSQTLKYCLRTCLRGLPHPYVYVGPKRQPFLPQLKLSGRRCYGMKHTQHRDFDTLITLRENEFYQQMRGLRPSERRVEHV